jgi:hypothetical protein
MLNTETVLTSLNTSMVDKLVVSWLVKINVLPESSFQCQKSRALVPILSHHLTPLIWQNFKKMSRVLCFLSSLHISQFRGSRVTFDIVNCFRCSWRFYRLITNFETVRRDRHAASTPATLVTVATPWSCRPEMPAHSDPAAFQPQHETS